MLHSWKGYNCQDMRTTWGDIAVSDAHVHFLSHRFFSILAQEKGGVAVESLTSTLDWEMPEVEPQSLARRWVAELDSHGVDRAALIASLPGDEESVATAVSSFPKRFYGYYMLNPTAADAVERTKKALTGGLLQGICLFPAMHRYSIQDERLAPILEMASQRTGTVVFVHCGVLTVGVRKKLGLPSLFDMRFSNPIDLHAVALRFPKVRFVVPHFGAGYLREALMLCDLCPNVYLDTSSSNNWIRYQDADLTLRTVFGRALEVAGPGRLLFGTDSSFFPRGWNAKVFHTQAQALEELGAGAKVARAIFSENLQKLLARG
jgi:predicted TIM-barrel fold metal-dependent hydrolase